MDTKYRSFDKCILCGSISADELASSAQLDAESRYRNTLFRRLFRPDTPDYILKDHVFFTHTYPARLIVCKGCGTVYRDPRLSESAAIDAYSNDTYDAGWMTAAFDAYYGAFRAQMPGLTSILGKPRVLEIGSHVGGFLAAARDYGWDAQGVDVGHSVCEFARSKSLRVFAGSVEEAAFPTGYFDAVFVWVCFDQLPDPWSSLREINRILVNGGHLFGKIPNGDFVKIAQRSSHWSPGWIRDYLWKFLAYAILLAFPFQIGYTPATLKQLLRRTGFIDIKVRNQAYIPVTNPQYMDAATIREELRYMQFIHRASQALYYLTGGFAIKGPWIEFRCTKDMDAL